MPQAIPRRRLPLALAAIFGAVTIIPAVPLLAQEVPPAYLIRKGLVDMDMRSSSRVALDAARSNTNGVPLDSTTPPPPMALPFPPFPILGGNVQVNDPALDKIQTFPGFRPFVSATNSETSVASYGANLVGLYNTSSTTLEAQADGSLAITKNLFSGYSYSNNGGFTWKSSYLPPLPGTQATSGDGVVDVDRSGNFYASQLGVTAEGNLAIAVNKSTDGGRTFAPAVVVESQGDVDKEWLATGPDPKNRFRDNIYVTWTDFLDAGGAAIRFARSVDGGASFATKTLFSPAADANPANPQNSVQFSVPVVDKLSGKIYIALFQSSFAEQDYLRIFTSSDGGETFSPIAFNVPGAPDPEVYPITQPGTLTECGARRVVRADGSVAFVPNARLTVHAGSNIGGSVSGFPRFVSANRVITQPAIAVSKGVLHLAWTNSTSNIFGEQNSGANILYINSEDDGKTWTQPKIVNKPGAATQRNVIPAISIGRFAGETGIPFLKSTNDVHIMYYTQEPDGLLNVNLAHSSNRGKSFPENKVQSLSTSRFALAPTNIPLPTAANPFATTNYNRLLSQCYSLGEYASIATGFGVVHALWADSRKTLQQPVSPLDPISGQIHPTEDVYFTSPFIP
jgi:hypothetical protein